MLSREAVRAVMAREDKTDPRYWAIRWQYHDGDGFFDELLRAAARADEENLRRLQDGFREIALAVYRWKNVPGWAREVEAWAESLVEKEAKS